jgi:hypothetical protein
MSPAALAGALLLAALPVRVESEACPSSAEVERALALLLPAASDAALPDLARVERRDGKLRIQLVDAKAAVIAERVLDGNGSCSDLAALAAAVIGSWESDGHPDFTRPHAELLPSPAVGMPAPASSPSLAYDVAVGASLSLAGSPAAGGTLALILIPRGAGPGLRLFAAGEAARTLDLGMGQARWQRWMGAAELDWRFARGTLVLDLHGGLGLGWLAVDGVGFSQNLSILTFSPAATAGARLSWWLTRRLAAWLDLGSLCWARGQTVYSQPSGSAEEIPQLLGLASIGLALGRVETGR